MIINLWEAAVTQVATGDRDKIYMHHPELMGIVSSAFCRYNIKDS